MRTPLVIVGALFVTTSIAAAQPPGLTESAAPEQAPGAYVGVGVMAGMDAFLDGQIAVEGGYHLRGAMWGHALVATGVAGDDQGGGPVSQGRAGIEGRTCTRPTGILCAYAGADVGYQSVTWHSHEGSSMDEHHDDAFGALRVGLDLGGSNLRVRGGLESYQLIAGTDTANGHAPGSLLGLNLTLGVAYQW